MLFVFVVLHSFFSFSDHFPYLFCYFCHVTVYISIHDNIGFQILYVPFTRFDDVLFKTTQPF